MNTKCLLTTAISSIISLHAFGQIEPDSLIGTYAGVRWFRWHEDPNWTIHNDTVYITDINGNNCRMIAITDDPWLGGTWQCH